MIDVTGSDRDVSVEIVGSADRPLVIAEWAQLKIGVATTPDDIIG